MWAVGAFDSTVHVSEEATNASVDTQGILNSPPMTTISGRILELFPLFKIAEEFYKFNLTLSVREES